MIGTTEKKTLATLAAWACLAAVVGAQPIDRLVLAYQSEETWEARRDALRRVTTSPTAAPAEFYVRALADLLAARDIRLPPRDEAARSDIKVQLVRQLGVTRALQSADVVYQVYIEDRDYLLRGTALEALGLMGSRPHLRPMTEVLARLASSPEGGAPGEAVCLGAIAGLEALGDTEGYPAVFYASFGRNSVTVHRRAQAALERIAPDPTDILKQVVARDSLLSVRLEALRVQCASKAPAARKNETAVTALADLTVRKFDSTDDRQLATQIRGLAVQTLIEGAAHNDDALPHLETVVRDEPDINVKLSAIQAIGVTGTDKAAAILTASLRKLNDRQENGDRLDDRVVRGTIRAIGLTGKVSARPELYRVKGVGYASGIVREAERVLGQLR
jgi:hypothetical protein